MEKSKNYSEEDFVVIDAKIKDKSIINNIEAFEQFAKLLNRTPWSLYNFIKRKFYLEIFNDPKIKTSFHKIHSTVKPKKRTEKKIIIPENYSPKKQKLVRPPAIYSNLNIEAWKNGLLDD